MSSYFDSWLVTETVREARRLADCVERGELTRADLEDAVRKTGDGEPRIALEILDAGEGKLEVVQ